ncbi:PREDICTED: serpin B12 [Lipotes vexillifer]|uniref:Serpin B12 n=1 Tax=Lipotes vexillifer TaxID=118797 RepID=A0A340XUE3_LIPVE|nr:PREDICTED: serpin B12 [Lipotes vexillifer]
MNSRAEISVWTENDTLMSFSVAEASAIIRKFCRFSTSSQLLPVLGNLASGLWEEAGVDPQLGECRALGHRLPLSEVAKRRLNFFTKGGRRSYRAAFLQLQLLSLDFGHHSCPCHGTSEITYKKLSNWIGSANMKDTAVVLYLLQLRLHGDHEDLTSILAALGMTDVFNHSRTNLSGITAGGGLRVSRIIHKAMLEVIETGSEFTLNNQTSKLENPELFKVDRPFLFFILHKETKMILFYGRVCNP